MRVVGVITVTILITRSQHGEQKRHDLLHIQCQF